jgi:hypothetical protein
MAYISCLEVGSIILPAWILRLACMLKLLVTAENLLAGGVPADMDLLG